MEKKKFPKIIVDIYSLNSEELLVTLNSNETLLYNIKNNERKQFEKKIHFDFIIPDFLYKNNIFIIDQYYKDFFSIYYYNNNINNYSKKIEECTFLINKESKKYNFNYIFGNIKKIITDIKINLEDEIKLKSIFKERNNLIIEEIMALDNVLLEVIDSYIMNYYKNNENYFNQNENIDFSINSNYIYYMIKKTIDNNNNNLNNEDKNKMKYIVLFVDCCYLIRKQYIKYIVLNTKINNVYNLKNEYLIFMGEKYLFVKYLIKNKEFIPITTLNYIDNKANDFNNYNISNITQNYIILNNFKEKIINFIDINSFCVLNKKYKYYSNVVSNNKYLLFDNIKDNHPIFSLINLNNLSKEKDNNLLELMNIKIDNNKPKSLLSNDFKTFVYLYENNQLCIDEYILNDKLDNAINLKNIKIINILKSILRIPDIISFSKCYGKDYEPKNLFNEHKYYCSNTSSNHYILFDFSTEYFVSDFTMIYHSSCLKCKPQNFRVIIMDENMNIVNIQKFCNKTISLKEENYAIYNKGRYIKLELLDNFGGEYIMIRDITFYCICIDLIL
jgi:hypothetical protein